MSGIIPVPTTRIGDFFIRQRLVGQVQSDQLDLFRLQGQVSTGRRLELPSDDAPAALRAIQLQRLLLRKDQIQANIQGSRQYLAATEANLGLVTDQLTDVRGLALSVADTVSTDEQRQTVVQRIDRVIQYLVDVGNSKSQGRHLFAGSRSQSPPYSFNGQYVEYGGNDNDLRSYVDLEVLFETNVAGSPVFGGVSAEVQGTVDLNPHLTGETLLSTLNGGAGVSKNAAVAVSVTTGGQTTTSIVDLSGAATIGDVARLIENSPPAGANLTAEVTGTGLVIQTDVGTVRVDEVAQGQSAKELGILTTPGAAPTSQLTGTDLNPGVLKTTRLADLLGTKAQARLVSGASNNDLIVTATVNGTATTGGNPLNGITIQFVDSAISGNEVATYDAMAGTLTVTIEAGISTAAQVAAAINAESSGLFSATFDPRDTTSATQAGKGAVELAATAVTSGGSGAVLDQASGILLTNGGESAAIDVSNAETVEDLINLIQGADLGFIAEINNTLDGINVRSQWSGADFTIGENGGTTATQLGIRSYTAATELADFNRGIGVPTSDSLDDLVITARDGASLPIDLTGAVTVQDVIDRINGHTSNNTGTTAVLARLASSGNGIELVDASTVTTGDLTVQAVEGSQAAEYLGFVPAGQTQVTSSTTDADGNYVLASEDRHTLETDSVFNTLIRLRTALEQNDVPAISEAIDRLDVDLDRVLFARGEIGTRLQSLDVIETRWDDDNVRLHAALSEEIDADLVEAVSNLTARQYALEASLRTTASLLQMSILNFI